MLNHLGRYCVIYLLLLVLAAAACGKQTYPAEAADGLYVRVDSVRHVVCYNRVGLANLQCLVLDSTNHHAIGGR